MRVCVYLAVFGDYNPPPQFRRFSPDIDYIYFTDKPIKLEKPWQLRVVDNKFGYSAVQLNRYYKMLPSHFLSEYEASLYLDGNVIVMEELTDFIEFAREKIFTAYHHPVRSCIIQEAAANLRLNRLSVNCLPRAAAQIRRYYDEGYRDTFLIEANILLRRHDSRELNEAMELWWKEFELGVKRDQISLGYVLWRNKVEVNVLHAPDRRSMGGVFYCVPHPKFRIRWFKGWLFRKWRMLTTSNKYWEEKLTSLMEGRGD